MFVAFLIAPSYIRAQIYLPSPSACNEKLSTPDHMCSIRSAGGAIITDPVWNQQQWTLWISAIHRYFVPYTGRYGIVIHYCKNDVHCTAKSSVFDVKSSETVILSSAKELFLQDADYKHHNKLGESLKGSYGYCMSFTDDKGMEWGNGEGILCSDAHPFPPDPAKCLINGGKALDVDMGTLDLDQITPTAGGAREVTKSVDVTCIRDAAISMKVKFNYDAITVGGRQVVQVKDKASELGIALSYNGKPVTPGQLFQDRFNPGLSTVTLGFTAVTDNPQSVKAGKFNASATMIMTED